MWSDSFISLMSGGYVVCVMLEGVLEVFVWIGLVVRVFVIGCGRMCFGELLRLE